MLPAAGTVPTSLGDLYVTPRTVERAVVASIHIANASGAARTATIYVNISGTSRAITPLNMALATDAVAISEAEIELAYGHKIEGAASGSGVQFLISGKEGK